MGGGNVLAHLHLDAGQGEPAQRLHRDIQTEKGGSSHGVSVGVGWVYWQVDAPYVAGLASWGSGRRELDAWDPLIGERERMLKAHEGFGF